MKLRQKIAAGVASVGLLAAGAANATVDPAVTTAIQGAGTDATTVAGAVLLVIVGVAAFKFIRKAI